MNLTTPERQRMIGALRLVFWGGLLCFLDFRIDGFDILNDFVGALLIAVGVARLAPVPVSERYRATMVFVQVVAIVTCVWSLLEQLPIAPPPRLGDVLSLLTNLLSLPELGATIAFCLAMRWACSRIGLPRAAASWWATAMLCLIIWGIPIGVLGAAWVVDLVARGGVGFSFHSSNPVAAVLVVLVGLLPLVHLFVSTSRMKGELEEQLA